MGGGGFPENEKGGEESFWLLKPNMGCLQGGNADG